MRLTKQTSDAVQILTHCYKQGDKLVKVGDIALALGLTKQMALKLANILSQADFIETVRGPQGGIQLSEPTKAATLGSIVRKLETQPTPNKGSSRAIPVFDSFVDEAFEAFLEVLDRHSLADMARKSKAAVKKRAKRKPARRVVSARTPRSGRDQRNARA